METIDRSVQYDSHTTVLCMSAVAQTHPIQHPEYAWPGDDSCEVGFALHPFDMQIFQANHTKVIDQCA